MANVFLSSDHHWQHANIIRHCDRPFSDVETMNEEMVERWNQVVAPGDLVYYLGDFSLTLGAVERITPRLNGKKYLIAGNHDHIHPYHRKARKPELLAANLKTYEEAGWLILDPIESLYINGIETPVTLCHFPYGYVPDYTDPRRDKYWKYRPMDRGQWLLCGHRHSKTQELLGQRCIDVGVDAHEFAPVSLDTITAIIRSQS